MRFDLMRGKSRLETVLQATGASQCLLVGRFIVGCPHLIDLFDTTFQARGGKQCEIPLGQCQGIRVDVGAYDRVDLVPM